MNHYTAKEARLDYLASRYVYAIEQISQRIREAANSHKSCIDITEMQLNPSSSLTINDLELLHKSALVQYFKELGYKVNIEKYTHDTDKVIIWF